LKKIKKGVFFILEQIKKELQELTAGTNALERVFIFQTLAKKYNKKHIEIMNLYFEL